MEEIRCQNRWQKLPRHYELINVSGYLTWDKAWESAYVIPLRQRENTFETLYSSSKKKREYVWDFKLGLDGGGCISY